MLNKALTHLLRQPLPAADEGRCILLVALPQFVIDDAWKHLAQLRKAAGLSQRGDCLAKFLPRRALDGHLHQLIFQSSDVDGHLCDPPRLSVGFKRMKTDKKT